MLDRIMSTIISARPILLQKNQDFDLKSNRRPGGSVKKVLFGPVDPIGTQKFLDDELNKHIANKSDLWNFDFKAGTVLDPNGNLNWKLLTPSMNIRPIKRTTETEHDISDQYHTIDNIDDRKIIRPTPVKLSPSPSRSSNIAKQTKITDFMRAQKRSSSAVETSKPTDRIPDIPHKRPRRTS